jgi:hypothetical protein
LTSDKNELTEENDMIKSENIQITSVAELVKAAELIYQKIGGIGWWRGQEQDWPLLPVIHRRRRGPGVEPSITSRFLNAARSRHANCPPQADYTAWLFLMRHYEFPTRLLDWTLSPLVAAFFSTLTAEAMDKPGVLWALDPMALNEHQGAGKIVLSAESPEVKALVDPAFKHGFPQSLKTLAIAPSEVDPRMMLQSSVFTLHGYENPLELVSNGKQFLYRFEIPVANKVEFAGELFVLGVRRHLLFPDLTNLAKSIVEEMGGDF